MKYYILLHNQITMAQATIMNSPEKWFPIEVEEVIQQLRLTVGNYRTGEFITEYQHSKLLSLIDSLEFLTLV